MFVSVSNNFYTRIAALADGRNRSDIHVSVEICTQCGKKKMKIFRFSPKIVLVLRLLQLILTVYWASTHNFDQ